MKDRRKLMFKRLITTGLVMCMLIIGARIYSYPVTCTKMMIRGTEVILLGDHHTYGDVAAVSFRQQIDDSNNILREWVQKLSHGSEETLFLLEYREPELSSREREAAVDLRIRDLGSERSDTIWFLKELSKSVSPTSNLKFKDADRRPSALDYYLLYFDKVITQIVSELFKGMDPVTIEAKFTEIGSRLNLRALTPSKSLKDLETEIRSSCRGEEFFSVTFPRGIEILRSLSDRSKEPSPSVSSAREFLDNIMRIVPELEKCRAGYGAGTHQHLRLGIYLELINKVRDALEAFFNTYLPDRTQSFGTAVLNSVERTHSFKSYTDLDDFEKGMNMHYTICNIIADAGFYMDITDAIRSGVKRVVLYAGANHTDGLEAYLYDYGRELVITEKAEAPNQNSEALLDIGHFLPPDDLRRILGMP